MTASPETRWLHRLAVLTACVALLPILMGALVTTKDAGMAFPDWPSSDGHNMLSYPWLKSAGAKFLEHGHRLAGVLIGLTSMALAVVAWYSEPRRWVR
jgi:cytochrome c oxidase assembly protein subunit 15